MKVLLCDHVANLGYIDRLLLEENLVTSHGRKAMLKYLIILANSAVACERFCRNGEVRARSDRSKAEGWILHGWGVVTESVGWCRVRRA